MIARVCAVALVLSLALPGMARADEIGGEDIVIPKPPPTPAPAPAPPAPTWVPRERPVTAPPPPHVELRATAVGAGLGLSFGEGVVTVRGEPYAFRLTGLAIGSLGVARLVAAGTARNLDRPRDLAGTYVAVEAAAAAGRGGSVVRMRNARGVVLELEGRLSGALLSAGAGGLRIEVD